MTTSIPPARRYLRHGTLTQLAAVHAVIQLGSVRRAAEALCVAQPTLSGHLRKLSDALGVRLFDTCGKHLVPTESARVLLRATNEIFSTLERCERDLAELNGGEPSQPAVKPVASAGASRAEAGARA